jgi:hypothetical protein
MADSPLSELSNLCPERSGMSRTAISVKLPVSAIKTKALTTLLHAG